jgi:hypothetical protein
VFREDYRPTQEGNKPFNEALKIFPPKDFQEGEVNFRYQAIRGILLIANSDVYEMIKDWSEGLKD